MEKAKQKQKQKQKTPTSLPLLPLRDVVIYPHMVIPLFVGRTESIKALEYAMEHEKQIFLSAQKEASIDAPKQKDIYAIGCVSTILQMLRLPDGTVKVLVEGAHRAKMAKCTKKDSFMMAGLEPIEEQDVGEVEPESQALMRSLLTHFEKLVKSNKKIPPELLASLSNIEDPGRLADSIAAHMTIRLDSCQGVLELVDVIKRLERVYDLVGQELDLAEVEKRVQGRVKQQVEKSQRQYYLSEKIKAIQQELGDLDDNNPADELDQLKMKIEKSGMPEEALEKAEGELGKLKMMPPMSAEATVCRNYLETMLDVPWKKSTKISKDLNKAEASLEADHYGLEEVKERILEYLAVQQRVQKLKGPILCLVGPPGVGKTSLGQSIANATGRKFARISLGGVRDEAEIRGHRRTYIGAMPGKIIQKLIKVDTRNPLFMLDEVDKMAMDFRGDPASALLEVLDPEQNNTFNDHYLEVDYDLSDVMFIATANSMSIPGPLLDRMEVIRLAGYTEEEKLNIATKYLIPRQIEACGLKKSELKVTDSAIREMIQSYTREAGVRNLEREISKLCRKVVRKAVSAKKPAKKGAKKGAKTARAKCFEVTPKNLEKLLGVKRFRHGLADEHDQVGQVTGLAWTEVGGELLKIEAQIMPGKGKALHTGSLGDVMQESIHAATTVTRSFEEALGIKEDYFHKHDFHIHVPEGATPKDGPSAGVGMCTALVSAITGIPVCADVAMTGEITLRGEVLPIGGLKEKLLAALRGGIKHVIIPEDNRRDLKEIPDYVTKDLDIHPVKWIDQVWKVALARMPSKMATKTKRKTKAKANGKAKPSRKAKTNGKAKTKAKKSKTRLKVVPRKKKSTSRSGRRTY
ncbi:MAG: endopeptidase La [Gammaproteobacteria bacterium]|nr:endopeptidase La [Gammaproteobacteria bacterium]